MCNCYRMFERKKAHAIQKQNTTPYVLSRGGYDFLEEKLMEDKKKKWLEEAAQSRSTDTIVDPPSPIKRHMKWKMACTKKSGQMMSEVAKEIADRIVSDSHLSVVIFYNNSWISKPNLLHMLTTGFPRWAGLTGKLCRPWMSECTNCWHWATRAPWSCPCC